MIPLYQAEIPGWDKAIQKLADSNFQVNPKGHPEFFLASAKAGIHCICRALELRRDDEVCIYTTSDEAFVSSCVTCTVFNYCKVSRVLTDATKLIIVIHEFGFEYQGLDSVIKKASELDIPVLEDCAHIITQGESHIGQRGDFRINSLPKSIPIQNGGLLIVNNQNYRIANIAGPGVDEDVREGFLRYASKISALNEKRREIYALYSEGLKQSEIFRMNPHDVPFFYGFKTNSKSEAEALIEKHAELGRNHVEGHVLIPLNPLAPTAYHHALIEDLKKFLG